MACATAIVVLRDINKEAGKHIQVLIYYWLDRFLNRLSPIKQVTQDQLLFDL